MTDDLVTVLNTWFDSRLTNIHTILPGEIVEYYGHTERKAKVKPLIKPKIKYPNEIKSISIEPIENVPVIFPSSNSFNLLFPLNAGDGVLLLFSESSMGNYLNSNIEVEADNIERFSLSDCIAIPGLFSFRNIPITTNSSIKIDSVGNITFNDGTESFIKGNTICEALTSLCTSIATATSGTPANNAAGIETIKTAFSVFKLLIENFKSSIIKGI